MATISQVAERAGVSPSTVSHVINSTRFVSNEAQFRVQQAMEELGYQPNALARSLRRGETRTPVLILPGSSNPFFAETAQDLEVAAFDLGHSAILCNVRDSPTKARLYLVVQPRSEMARAAMQLLMERMADRSLPKRRRILPPVLVARESSRPPYS